MAKLWEWDGVCEWDQDCGCWVWYCRRRVWCKIALIVFDMGSTGYEVWRAPDCMMLVSPCFSTISSVNVMSPYQSWLGRGICYRFFPNIMVGSQLDPICSSTWSPTFSFEVACYEKGAIIVFLGTSWACIISCKSVVCYTTPQLAHGLLIFVTF